MKQENIVIVMLNKLTDLVVSNLLFLVCSLPIITVGASLCGLYAVNLRSVRYGDGYVLKTFFTGFRKSFKQATIVWLVTMVMAFILFIDFRFWTMNPSPLSKPMLAISLVMVMFILMVLTWLYPLIAKTEDSLPRLIKNAELMAIGYFVPYTVACMGISMGAGYLAYINPGVLFIMILIGFSLVTYLQSFFLYRVFAKHMEEESAGFDDMLYAPRPEDEDFGESAYTPEVTPAYLYNDLAKQAEEADQQGASVENTDGAADSPTSVNETESAGQSDAESTGQSEK